MSVTNLDVFPHTVGNLDDRPNLPADEMKAKFEQDCMEVWNKVREVVPDLNTKLPLSDLVKVVSSSSTDAKVPTAKAVYDAIADALLGAGGTIAEAIITDWLDEHPEATTTVADGAITNAKLATSFVTPGVAAAYVPGKWYPAGSFVFADGKLYTNIDDVSDDEWTAAHWAEVSIGDSVTNLKREVSAICNPETVTSEWVQGSLDTTDGMLISSTTRIRSFFIKPSVFLKVSAPNGMKISYRMYTAGNISSFVKSSGWTSGTIFVPAGNWYRFVAAYENDATILPTVGDSVTFVDYKATDTTLSKADVAADAKAAGDKISETMMLANAALKLQKANDISVNAFIQGSIAYDTGGNMLSDTRLRSAGYLQFPKTPLVKVTVKEGYKAGGRVYEGNPLSSSAASNVYIGYLPEGETAGFASGEWYFAPNADYFYRFVLAFDDDSEITPEDVDGEDAISLEYYTQQEEAVSVNSSLLGNVSIRAAKVFTFDDGTYPVVDWYLLQDVNNNFYKSKDLLSQQYLFTFVAPSSTVSNWSCGIDVNDNVIFVKDAAGYTAEDGARLDDGKRVNPVYFLASEQYETVHELDFGASFRPAGWLTNVGWCLLPNGDVVFCEYTRGTLATCNVWHITGDITNPENWHRVWQHAIVDSISGSETEMKHCHCVMYDFFTGVCYFSTGDGSNSSFIYHSTDNGENWELTYGPNRDRCRQLNFVFTEDYVYWASDSYEADDKHFFIARRDNGGIVDVENATAISIPAGNSQSCYGCVYIRDYDLIVMMDRADNNTTRPLTLRGYSLVDEELVTLASIPAVGESHVGFRTKYIEWYPTGNRVPIGFNPRSGSVTVDVNANAVCGNDGSLTGDGSTRINNLLMYVYNPSAGSFNVRFGTIPLK